MTAQQLGKLLLDEMPSRVVVVDIGGFKIEVVDAKLTSHEDKPAIELLTERDED